MEKKYYIVLRGQGDTKKWYYSSIDKRNEDFEKIKREFEKHKSNKIPFIEVDIGIDESGMSITFPLRLNVDVRDDVINYIKSLS